jgi:8-oxo-dGTP diphosphatase
MTAQLQPMRRVAAYAICIDSAGRALLVRESARSGTPGVWTLPGGAVWHGEHPAETVAREAADEAGLTLRTTALSDVVADTRVLRTRGLTIHTDRVLYEATAESSDTGPTPSPKPGSPLVDDARWVSRDEAASLQLRPFAANALKLPLTAVDLPPEQQPDLPSFLIVDHPDGRRRVQRFAAYAVVRDGLDQVLLTRIADGYPGAGRWHLPGGGTDFGEQPADALLRELAEESGYAGRVVALLGIGSHHEPEQVGPEGFPIDWHGVRAYYDVVLESDQAVREVEAGGSSAEARWFPAVATGSLPLTEATQEALAAIA